MLNEKIEKTTSGVTIKTPEEMEILNKQIIEKFGKFPVTLGNFMIEKKQVETQTKKVVD